MKANENLTLTCQNTCHVTLVPYRKEHVLKYHEWMQDPDLQEATASEPLSLEEEYAMQQSWCQDENKCTFIILDGDFPDTEGTGTHGGAMAGDVNIFLNDHDEPSTAEIEIMVAEPRSRRKGIARAALMMFMTWSAHELGITKFRAKIGFKNVASQNLFQSLGFRHVATSEVFQEKTFEFFASDDSCNDATKSMWNSMLSWREKLQLGTYDKT